MANENGEWIMHGMAKNDPARIRTVSALEDYVNQIGFLPLFKNEIDDFSVEEHTYGPDWWSDNEAIDPWEWRKLIAAGGRIAYGKFFNNKAGYISLDWLPVFANWRRDGYDFDARWEDEKASHRQKKLMDLFSREEPLYSFEMKELGGFGKGGEKNFEGTLTSLQMQTYLVVCDFRQRKNKAGIPYGWGIALYTTPELLWGSELISSGYSEAPAVSKQRIYAHIQKLFPQADEAAVKKAFGGLHDRI